MGPMSVITGTIYYYESFLACRSLKIDLHLKVRELILETHSLLVNYY